MTFLYLCARICLCLAFLLVVFVGGVAQPAAQSATLQDAQQPLE